MFSISNLIACYRSAQNKMVQEKQGISEKSFDNCIYCGSIEDLTNEHALARAFNGHQILRKASCKKCASITSTFELRVLRGMFYDYRHFKRFRSRKKMKSFKLDREYLVKNNHGEISKIKTEVDSMGSCLFMPEFKSASTRRDSKLIIGQIWYLTMYNNDGALPNGVSEVLFSQNFFMEDFLRFLAKTTYCFANLAYKQSEIEFFILPLILEGKRDYWHYIGTPKENVFTENDRAVMIFESKGIITCHIKLFNELPLVYEVIVGKIKDRKRDFGLEKKITSQIKIIKLTLSLLRTG